MPSPETRFRERNPNIMVMITCATEGPTGEVGRGNRHRRADLPTRKSASSHSVIVARIAVEGRPFSPA